MRTRSSPGEALSSSPCEPCLARLLQQAPAHATRWLLQLPVLSRAAGWLVPVTRFEGKIKQGMCSWFPGPWGVGTPSLCCCQLCPAGQEGPTLLPTRLCTGPGTGLPGTGLPAPGVSPPARMVPQGIIWHNCWGFGPLQNPVLWVQQRWLQTLYNVNGRREKVTYGFNAAAHGGKPGRQGPLFLCQNPNRDEKVIKKLCLRKSLPVPMTSEREARLPLRTMKPVELFFTTPLNSVPTTARTARSADTRPAL